ncbi:hypothetical protein ACROYT_G031314 [Oculina patagonica]
MLCFVGLFLQKFSPLSRNPYICFYSGDLRPATKRKVRLDEVYGKTDTKPIYNPSSRCDAYRWYCPCQHKPSGTCKTFSGYAYQVNLPQISNQLPSVQQIDIIWERCIPNKRGRGVRRRVEADVKLPDSWGESLKEESNKTELILYVRAQQVNGDGHNLSQMHGSLSGPHHLKHQQYARELVK